MAVLFSSVHEAQAASYEENQVKAVFLFNLTKFVVWPEKLNENPNFTIAIVGNDPFGTHLDRVVKNETVQQRSINIRRIEQNKPIPWQEVDLIFISKDQQDKLPELIKQAFLNRVLTVGDVKGFCESGGMINLLSAGRRVRIEVNVERVRKSDFLVKAQVLKLSRIVETDSGAL